VTVDVAAVTFLDATGIAVLAGQRNRLREQGGGLMLRSPHGIVRRALEVTGLSDWVVDGERAGGVS
jgi:anti-anti-sigma factor